MLRAAEPATFLIADISGYTSYLVGVEIDHAQDILADLMGAVVGALRPAFRLAKLEGDAAFTFSPAERVDGTALLDAIERSYFGFRRRRRDVRQATTCHCNACIRIPDLDLKFVVHHGSAIRQKVMGREELLGADVIVVHRLLKNEVKGQLGMPAYALLTQATLDRAGLDPDGLGMRPYDDTYEGIGEVPAWALDLARRWQEEEERARVFVTPEQAMLDVQVETSAPPQVAWEFLTAPERRMAWQPWVTGVDVKGAPGGRRGVGGANHCSHGKDAVIEEIVDWRPYDYLSDWTVLQTPGGLLRLLHTVELEPIPTGTRIHMRFAPPKGRKERAIAKDIGDHYGDALRAHLPGLLAQLDADVALREADRAPEAELPAPRPDGILGAG